MATLSQIAERIRKCTRCPLWKHRLQALPGEGQENAKYVIILESPDEIADRKGDLWETKEAKKLAAILKEKNIAKEDVFLTSLVKCSPCGSPVDTREIEECHSYLQDQLHTVSSKKIYCVGERSVPQNASVIQLSSVGQLQSELEKK